MMGANETSVPVLDKERSVRVDPLLLCAVISLALLLGALLTVIAYRGMIARVVALQLDEEIQRRAQPSPELNNAA